VRGVFSTGVQTYDEGTVYMPLPKAQAITNTGERISAVILLTENAEAADPVAGALSAPGYRVVTWEDMNALILGAIEQGMVFYIMIYAIVILIMAVLIANTLLMSVFERTRELGILAALGMKGRQIMMMILLEAGTLALLGVIGGVVLGSLVVWYMSFNGPILEMILPVWPKDLPTQVYSTPSLFHGISWPYLWRCWGLFCWLRFTRRVLRPALNRSMRCMRCRFLPY
jgi:ABC-type lipoprotein release transport system permease subunit